MRGLAMAEARNHKTSSERPEMDLTRLESSWKTDDEAPDAFVE